MKTLLSPKRTFFLFLYIWGAAATIFFATEYDPGRVYPDPFSPPEKVPFTFWLRTYVHRFLVFVTPSFITAVLLRAVPHSFYSELRFIKLLAVFFLGVPTLITFFWIVGCFSTFALAGSAPNAEKVLILIVSFGVDFPLTYILAVAAIIFGWLLFVFRHSTPGPNKAEIDNPETVVS